MSWSLFISTHPLCGQSSELCPMVLSPLQQYSSITTLNIFCLKNWQALFSSVYSLIRTQIYCTTESAQDPHAPRTHKQEKNENWWLGWNIFYPWLAVSPELASLCGGEWQIRWSKHMCMKGGSPKSKIPQGFVPVQGAKWCKILAAAYMSRNFTSDVNV